MDQILHRAVVLWGAWDTEQNGGSMTNKHVRADLSPMGNYRGGRDISRVVPIIWGAPNLNLVVIKVIRI